jgi:5-formyltetrahydrofolate cyclo-ligase
VTDPSTIRTRKRRLRRSVIERRDALPAAVRAAASSVIARTVMDLDEMRGARTVHLFASFGSEVDTGPIIEGLLETGRRPVLPVVVSRDGAMEHAAISTPADLEPGFKDIPEPTPACPRVGPDEIDLVIVPGVAFGRSCGRMGYGGGFYDRFLAACAAPRIAIAFSLQVVQDVPCDEHDLPVHAIVTESEIIRS